MTTCAPSALARTLRRHLVLPAVAMVALLAGGTALAGNAPPAPVDADRSAARELLDELVKVRTAKGQGLVPGMARTLADRFRAAGFAEKDIKILPVDIDGETTAGMLVRYRGHAASGKKPIIFLAHMDVVDADAGNWTTDPFEPTEIDGYLYGRGTVDNKGQLSLLAITFERLKRAGWVPGRDLLLAFSGDEESGSETTRMLTRHPWLQGAEYALNADAGTGQMDGDGRNLAFFIQAAEKTSVSYQIVTRNSGGHSSMPRPDNALYEMASAIKAIEALRFPVQFNDINRAMVQELAASRGGELGRAFATLLRDPDNADARAIVEQAPEDAHVLWTTCVPTMIDGGNARNALPQRVDLTVHCRIFPGVEPESIQAALVAAIDDPAISVTVGAQRGSSPPSDIHPQLFAAVRKAVDFNYPGASLTPEMSSGGTDGRYFRQVGIPTYGIGSLAQVHPDDDRMHGIDERLRLDSFGKELDFWNVLLTELAGTTSPPER